jgi:DNA repair exonuclease SbcCD nuclease subunit
MTFKKAIVWTDIHFGKRSNSDQHNQDCVDFIDWIVSEGKKNQCETTICCGDFFDVRNSLNIRTMDYGIKALHKLSEAFSNVIIILGNHDLFYRHSTEIYSLKFAKEFKNIKIIDETTVDGDCTFVPWIADGNYEQLGNINTKYVFAHLELPNFYTNSMMALPDHGQANAEMFNGPQYVFSGHFHKRQHYVNKNGSEIIYIGNCFPHNYSDINDSERGCMLLENGGEPIFVNWTDCPKYQLSNLSELIETPENILTNKTYLRVDNDMELTYDEINFIRDTLQKQFDAREIILLPKKSDDLLQNYAGADVEFKSVDHIVLSHLEALDTGSFDKQLLSTIYLSL